MTTQEQEHSPGAGALPGDATQEQDPGARAPRSRAVAAAIPVILVNTVAFAGQLAFLREHLHWPLAGQIVMAVALESIAVYLAYHAHVAQVVNDSALRLRLASYAFGAGIGAMNYSHYAGPGWRPTFSAVAVGLMSASSPWLWAIHSRRASRDVLLASGQIEPHALRLGPTRWMWHPYRSYRVMFKATWAGITAPREAIRSWEHERSRPAAPAGAPAVTAPASRSGKREQIQERSAPAPGIAAPPSPPALPAPVAPETGHPTVDATEPGAAEEQTMTAPSPSRVRSIQSQRERLAALVQAARDAEAKAKRQLNFRELKKELGVGSDTTSRVLKTLRAEDCGTTEDGDAASSKAVNR